MKKENKKECEHICSGNCRREGCNCICGEFHEAPLSFVEEKHQFFVNKFLREDSDEIPTLNIKHGSLAYIAELEDFIVTSLTEAYERGRTDAVKEINKLSRK